MSANLLRRLAGLAFVLGLVLFVYGFAFGRDDPTHLAAAPEATVTSAEIITLAGTPQDEGADSHSDAAGVGLW